MVIELRSLYIAERLTNETTAFTASLYINRKKVGYARNSGNGGSTDYGPDNYHDEVAKDLIEQAEKYCLNMPPVKINGMSLPMNLEFYIENIVSDAWQEKENKRFKTGLKKNCINALCIGNNETYSKIYWPKKNSKWTISELLATEVGRKAIQETIQKYKATMKPGDRILNQNIPEDLL